MALPLRRILTLAVLAVVVIAILWAVTFYSSDGTLEADVKEKRCSPVGESQLIVVTRWFGFKHTAQVEYFECQAVPVGAFVQYHVRSARTVVFEAEGGRCIFDTAHRVC